MGTDIMQKRIIIGSMRSKGVNRNYTPVHYVSCNPTFIQSLKYVGATVIEFRLFNRMEKKKKNKKNMDNL